jgi:hypothetical protein
MKMILIKEHTGRRLTWSGRFLVLLLVMGLLIGLGATLYPFLAPSAKPHHGLMVVEGWIHDFALDEAVAIYRAGDYTKLICTGVPVEVGSYIQDYKSYPEMTAARLRKLGVDPAEIVLAIAEDSRRDRTYAAAVALREAIMAYSIEGTDLHLVTTGPHGRRSRMLFQKALGNDYTIGVTCIEEYAYDQGDWYMCSAGVRDVVGEFIAFTYAKFFFHP